MYRFTATILLGLLIGCGGKDDNSDDSAEGTSTTPTPETSSSTGEECSPGLEGCTCYGDDLCLVGLTCLSNTCVDAGALTSATSGEEATSEGGEGEGSTGDGFDGCIFHQDCTSIEVCFNAECVGTLFLEYEATVNIFAPPDCSDGVGRGELIYQAYLDGEFVRTSSESTCPGGWPEEPLAYNPNQAFQIDFYESDGIGDDFLATLCWVDSKGNCSRIPPNVLHDGYFSGLTDGFYEVEMFVTAVSKL